MISKQTPKANKISYQQKGRVDALSTLKKASSQLSPIKVEGTGIPDYALHREDIDVHDAYLSNQP